MQNKFLAAETICFFGFGFDKDNLVYLGLLDEARRSIKEVWSSARQKKIFVARVDVKILQALELVFHCRMNKYSPGVFRSDQGNIIASERGWQDFYL